MSLSEHERRVLQEIEQRLDEENPELRRRLDGMGASEPGRWRATPVLASVLIVVLPVLTTAILLVGSVLMSVHTGCDAAPARGVRAAPLPASPRTAGDAAPSVSAHAGGLFSGTPVPVTPAASATPFPDSC